MKNITWKEVRYFNRFEVVPATPPNTKLSRQKSIYTIESGIKSPFTKFLNTAQICSDIFRTFCPGTKADFSNNILVFLRTVCENYNSPCFNMVLLYVYFVLHRRLSHGPESCTKNCLPSRVSTGESLSFSVAGGRITKKSGDVRVCPWTQDFYILNGLENIFRLCPLKPKVHGLEMRSEKFQVPFRLWVWDFHPKIDLEERRSIPLLELG